jgi:hypothetical protein
MRNLPNRGKSFRSPEGHKNADRVVNLNFTLMPAFLLRMKIFFLWLDSITPLFLPDYRGRTHDFCSVCVMPVQLAEGRFDNLRTVQTRVIREKWIVGASRRQVTSNKHKSEKSVYEKQIFTLHNTSRKTSSHAV